jgi:hypothetical protein
MPVRPVGRDQRPWSKGLLIGQKKPLEPEHVWSIRVTASVQLRLAIAGIFVGITQKAHGYWPL